ncbi:hypothetical protein [uncultured Bradyrhizobium sp.]|uniref:hypothetical protein n=1 Tax=uncultured Bradyrhizobium sp. TaxID=199684 RepID=UPI002605AE40|nr:hypothetical protein [uncultured Bradyrhizobium sp.]
MAQIGQVIGFCLILALALFGPFVLGSLVGVAFAGHVKRRGWRPQVITVWPISVMFGTLGYVVVTALLFAALIASVDFRLSAIFAGLALGLFYTWPIWLLMGPVLFVYVSYLRNRRKWLRDSTVVYLSALTLTSECAFLLWFWQSTPLPY